MSQLQAITARIDKLQARAREIEAKAKTAGIRQIIKIMQATAIGLEDLASQLGAKAAFSAKGAAPGSKRGESKASPTLRRAVGKKTAKTKGVIKYRDPSDPSKAWTGHGRAPNWIKDKDRDQFLVRS